MACAMSLATFAQDDFEGSASIDEIINMQQAVTETNLSGKHFEQVWGRKSFLNINYNTSTLDPKETTFPKNSGRDNIPYVETGGSSVPNGGRAPKYESDWGASLVYGRNYNLHKKPIVNILFINLDYTPLDLNANHYKALNNGVNIYNSDDTYALNGKSTSQSGTYNYVPWNYEKYEFNYGMTLGPSLTIAPFTYTNIKALHFIKVNAYYHIGYHVSLLLMKNSDRGDMAERGANKNKVANSAKLEFGHGLIQSFGFNVSWKSIGVGYEVRTGGLKYLSIDSENFGKTQYKFDALTSRVYLQIRL